VSITEGADPAAAAAQKIAPAGGLDAQSPMPTSYDTQARDLLLSLLGAAAIRLKQAAIELDSISFALKGRLISLEGTVDWLLDLGLYEHVVEGVQ
jgi:hypothetical protein